MIKDITIGQYYPADSVIHRLDPRMKLAATFAYIISLFLFRSFSGYLAAAAAVLLVIRVSRVPFLYVIRGLKVVLFLMFFMMFFNIFFTTGNVIYWHWKFLTISDTGVRNALFMGLRLLFLVVGSSMMTFTTTPNQLTDGLERILAPLQKLHVPAHEIAMMMSIALRFIPILLEETDKIMKAQQARGADFDTGNVIRRAKALVPVLVPLFVSAFRRADDLAVSTL